MAIARKIAYNVVFNVIAKIFSTILALVAIGLITRYLGKEGFGDYSTVLAFFSFFGSFADLGLYSITAREISRVDADEKFILGNALSIRIIASLFVLLLTPVLIYFLPYSINVKYGILIAAASFAFSSTYMVLNGVFQKNLAMDKVAMAEIIGKIVQVGVVIIAVTKNLGFQTIILSMLASMIVNFILVFLQARKFISLSLNFNFNYWKVFLRESVPMGISVFVIFIYFKIDTILLSVLKTSADVGIYNAAYKVIENITFFPSMIAGLVFPLFSRYIFTDKERFKYIANETATVFFILIIPIIIGTQFLAGDIVKLIGGNAFADSANTLRILIFALSFIFFGNLFNNVLIAGNLQKKMLLVLSFCAAFNLTANLIFIPKFSYTASATISVLTEMLVVLSSMYLCFKYVSYLPKIRNGLRILISGFIMAIFLLLFKNMNFLFLALGSAATYILFLWITKTITLKELKEILTSKRSENVLPQV